LTGEVERAACSFTINKLAACFTYQIKRRSFLMKMLVSICIGMLLVTFSAWGLFYDFENKAQLKEWEIIDGDWKIANGVL